MSIVQLNYGAVYRNK